MKKSLLAAAVLSAVSFGAYADGVELYGLLDVGVAAVPHSLSGDSQYAQTINPVSALSTGRNFTTPSGASAPSSVDLGVNNFQGMINGGLQGSRWGIKGSEDLGDGMKAQFQLESGININSGSLNNNIGALNDGKTVYASSNGSLNGQLFGRTAWVGLSDDSLGLIKFGRNYSQAYDLQSKYDPVQFGTLVSPLGFSGSYGGGMGISENVRQDNSLKYSGKNGDWSYGVMYKFGNQAGSTSFGTAKGITVEYQNGPFSAGIVYQTSTDALKTDAGSTVAVQAYDTKGYAFALRYKLNNAARVSAGVQRYALQAASDKIAISSTSSSYINVASDYNVTVSKAQSYTGTDQGVTVTFLGGDYDVSDKLNIAAGYYHVALDSYTYSLDAGSSTAVTSTPVASGDVSYISFLADYKLSKRTDIYGGAMVGNFSGAQSATLQKDGSYYSNNSVVTIGMRHKF